MGIESPWHVIDVRLDAPTAMVEVVAKFRGDPCCPKCRKKCAGYDSCRRVFCHLDTCQFKTHLIVDVPRLECEEHGVLHIDIAYEDEVCLASEAQHDEAAEEIAAGFLARCWRLSKSPRAFTAGKSKIFES